MERKESSIVATNEKDYNEILLQAMDTLIQHRLQGLEFDRTVKCQIIQDKGQGVFIVKENDSVQYEASATNTINAPEYKVDDWVYVLIPSGDYSRYKMIVGKYTDDNRNNPVAYVPPLGTVVSMTNNINTTTNSEGILANGDLKIKELGVIDLSVNDSADIKYNAIYDTLALTASFKTLFNNASMVSGNYGLLLRLIEDDGSETAVLLDSSEMFGDPYNYSIYLKQSKAFDISTLDNLSKIRVALYQQKNFEYYDESKGENARYPIDGVAPNNIFVKDIIITLGQDVKTIPDNQFRISVVDGILEYAGSQNKDIRSTWYNKTEDNEFIGFSDGVVDTSYDEDAYMDSYENDWIGMAFTTIKDVPPLRETLQIYSNSKQIEDKLNTIIKYVDVDINTILQEIYQYLQINASNDEDLLSKFNDDIIGKFNNYNSTFKRLPMVIPYQEYLQICNDYYIDAKPINISDDSLNCGGSVVGFTNLLITTQSSLKTLLQEDLISQELGIVNYKEFTSYIETQIRRMQVLLDKIEFLINGEREILYLCKRADNITNKSTNDEEEQDLIIKLTERFSKGDLTPIEQEYQEFVDKNKNKYCIYWYEKDLAAAGDRWVEAGWKRTTDFKNGTPGMPVINEGDTIYPKTSPNPYPYTTDPNLATDSVKAILFYNHIKYESNILEFKNLEPPQDTTQADIADAVYIEHSNNSEGSYQKYNSTYGLVSAVDGLLNRALKVRYDGFAQGDEGLIGTTAYWYVPNQATMLTYNKVKLTGAGYSDLDNIDEKTTTDPVLQEYLKHKRTGFKCFYKSIRQGAEATETELAKPLESDTLFYYMIAKVFKPAFSQNTIYCVINKDGFDYEGSINFTFSTFGTSGTDYTVSIVPAGTQYAIEPNNPLELEIGFSYLDGLTVKDPPTPSFGWYGPHYDKLEASKELGLDLIDFTQCLYNVLKCDVEWKEINEETSADQTLTLSSVYPVAIASGSYYLEGATTVIYDDQGTSPTYYNKKYKLFERHTNEEVKNITWDIIHYDDEGQIIANTETEILRYAPTLQYVEKTAIFKESGYYLKPLNMYISDSKIYSVVVAKQGNNILLAQPIYIGQHRWGSTLLNSWNESLTIDEENGTILSTMMGAGYKDNQNRFHGVLMGDVAVGANTDTASVGLYGFHEGAQSFAWKVDGTGFIGKSGRGRIEFDGNKGIIHSASFNMTNGSAGTEIDLDDGRITLKGAKYIRVDPNDENSAIIDYEKGSNSLIQLDVISPYFKINSKDGNTLMLVGDTSMYLQSNNYVSADDNTEDNPVPAQGMKIDLNDGHIDAYNFKLTSENIDLNSNPTDGNNYLLIGNEKNYIKYLKKNANENELSIQVDNLTIKPSGSNNYQNLSDYIEGSLDSLNKEEIVNRLREGETEPGIYLETMDDGTQVLFIHADCIKTGVLASTNNNMQIHMDTGLIEADNFALQTSSIQINSTGLPYFDIKHSYTASGNVQQSTSVFTISADGTFKLQSVPLNSNETINYYVIINSKEDSKNGVDGFNYRSGTLDDEEKVVMGDTLGVYPYTEEVKDDGTRVPITKIPVTTQYPYQVKGKPNSFAYQSVDGTWFYCAIDKVLYLKLSSSPSIIKDGPANTGTNNMESVITDPAEFVAFVGTIIGDSSNKMSIDLQAGSINIGGGAQTYLDNEGNSIDWTTSGQKKFNLEATKSTDPFTLGSFSVDWDGKLTGTLNNKRKWYIQPNGGASFGWLSSGSISCSKLIVGGTNISNELSSLKSGIVSANTYIGTVAGKVADHDIEITNIKGRLTALEQNA